MPALTRFLQGYSHTEDWYLGRPSISHPIEVLDRANPGVSLTESLTLTRFLQDHSHTEDWYLCRPSISHPIEVLDRANPGGKSY